MATVFFKKALSLTPISLTGVLAWYQFEGDLSDSSINGNDATDGSLLTYPDGIFDKCVRNANSTSSAYYFTTPTNVRLSLESTEYSITAWYRLTQSDSSPSEITRYIYWAHANYFYILVDSSGKITYRHRTTSLESITTLANGSWMHIVCTFSTINGQKLYINGSLEASSSTAYQNNTLNNPIGHFGGSGSGMNADIDESQFYSREITASEVTQLYEAGQQSYKWQRVN